MPYDLVLVRHGNSEGNEAVSASKRGDDRFFTTKFLSRHSSTWRLTDLGREQARVAGEWIRRNIGEQFDRYYTSEYVRTLETAALLGLPDARWYTDFILRERDRGVLDVITHKRMLARYAGVIRRRSIDPFFWRPPEGESMAEVCLRIDRLLHTLHRECDGKRVIIVCHGEVMWAFRVRLERMSQQRFKFLDASTHPHHRIHNGQVIHYTRRDPRTGNIRPYLDWMRSVCATDPSLSDNEWQRIHRPVYTNADLLDIVEGETL